jgi:glycerol-3-phosphate dehydrogenase (NAD(P)+)
MPGRPLAVLSGPTFAEEVAAGLPTAITVASSDASNGASDSSLAARVALALGTASFRPYVSDDVVGVEVGGAVKNVLAIACGVATGLGFRSNTRAALITRGLEEMKRLAEALGGRRETVTGLAGIGDLMLTCSSEQSRNMSFGLALGRGATPAEILDGKAQVVEGVVNAVAVTDLARAHGVEMPICEAVRAVLDNRLSVADALAALLGRPLRAEPKALDVALPPPASPEEIEAHFEGLAS